MADPGDFIQLKNEGSTVAVPNAGTNLDDGWDTIVNQFGGIPNSNGTLTLDGGLYLLMYSEYFTTTDTTNNERIEVQGFFQSVTNGTIGGYGQGFIRKSSGDQDCVVRGSMIYDSDVDEEVFVRFNRTDNSTTGTVNRVTNTGGYMALRLDGADNYAIYPIGTQSLSVSTTSTIVLGTASREDSPQFSETSNVITVQDAGRYLVTYQMDINQPSTGREDVIAYLRDNSVEITGTRSFCYLRGSDGTQDGALTWIGILDLPAGATLDLRAQCPTSATINITAGGLQIWQLPSGNETAINEATTGNYNASGTFTWNTTPHIDTAEFTTLSNSGFTIDNEGLNLVFATFAQFAPDSPQRAVPLVRVEIDGVVSQTAAGDGYHRNSGGTGYLAITVADAFFGPANTDVEINTTPTAASGTLTNDSAQFAILNLNSIFGAYVPPPTITQVDNDDQIIYGQNNIVVTGQRFEALQGTGKLELWSDTIGTIKTVQTIDSWSDTSIQFDSVQGSLPEDQTIYAVVTTDAGKESPPFPVFEGIPPLDNYFTVFDDMNPDHWWRFNNDGYADSAGANPITNSVVGDGGSFETVLICEQNTHSWLVDGGARRECANSNNMNGQTETTRTMCGWIRLGGVDPALSCLYEEGGGVNNLALFLGMGNVLIASYADTSDDNAQAFSDFSLASGRDYFWTFTFDHGATIKEFRLWLDGVKQSVTIGNPLTSGDLDAHSGDISFGGPGGSLEVGGTDVTFQTQSDTYYANWASWTRELSAAEILELFERGARPQVTITTDTAANMQAAIDLLADTAYGNHALTMRIEETSSGLDLDLDFDNITFDENTSVHLEWRGAGTLTVTNLNGANLDVNKTFARRGGSVTVVNPANLTLTGLQNPSEVRVYEAGTTTEVAGQENVTTGEFSATIQTSSVDIVIASVTFQNIRLLAVDTSNDISLPIQQRFDRNYENP